VTRATTRPAALSFAWILSASSLLAGSSCFYLAAHACHTLFAKPVGQCGLAARRTPARVVRTSTAFYVPGSLPFRSGVPAPADFCGCQFYYPTFPAPPRLSSTGWMDGTLYRTHTAYRFGFAYAPTTLHCCCAVALRHYRCLPFLYLLPMPLWQRSAHMRRGRLTRAFTTTHSRFETVRALPLDGRYRRRGHAFIPRCCTCQRHPPSYHHHLRCRLAVLWFIIAGSG